MERIPGKILLMINIIVIALELIILLLTFFKVLSFGYGWDYRINVTVFIAVILTQIYFLYLIGRSVGKENRRRHYLAQAVLIVIIAIWMIISIDIY